jgi:hypothetical protein
MLIKRDLTQDGLFISPTLAKLFKAHAIAAGVQLRGNRDLKIEYDCEPLRFQLTHPANCFARSLFRHARAVRLIKHAREHD